MTAFSLWDFSQKMSPLRCAAYLCWRNITAEELSKNRKYVRAELLSILRLPYSMSDEDARHRMGGGLTRRAEMMRFRAIFLIGTYLPDNVRRELMSGRYIITACRPDGDRVEIQPDDFCTLDIDLLNGRLISPNRTFGDVAIHIP
ncbi:hypothetical protein PHAMO_180116 [Magnetospirillum molischianum DSM 120]|uniref:Uncharacterized protein n=1 Tax=Magnetospirillum molischianum DSM 120 TaxID=1150626 RepID=H8FP59_MAGML|nr:hypothetical protein PHAMO_180116 [Magnetospirillum molischianum DSM 120]